MERSMWDHQLGLPCIRVASNPYNFLGGGYHGKAGDLLLYLSCKRRGSRFEWKYVNLETGEQLTSHSHGWEPSRYLNECSAPLENT